MADLKERLALQIAGFANLVSQKGCLVCGDGEQATYLTTTGIPDGYVLSKDSTSLEGLKWVAGGGSSLSFTDGVTNNAGTVSNDLVTGVAVDEVDAIVNLSGTNSQLHLDTDGTVLLRSGDTGAGTEALTILGGAVTVTGENSFSATGGAGSATLTNATNSQFRVNGSTGDLELTTTAPNTDIIATTSSSGNVDITSGSDANTHLKLTAKGGQEFIQLGGGGSANNKVIIQADGTGANGLVAITGSSAVNIISGAGNGGIQLNSQGSTGDINILSGLGIQLSADGLIDVVTANGSIGLASGPADAIGIHAGALGVTLDTTGIGDININSNHDEIHTVGRNLTMTVAGSGGASLSTTVGNFTIDAGTGDEDAEVRLMPRGAPPAATLTFRIWDGAGAGQQAFLAPSGGSVVDVEMRSVFSQFMDYMVNWGWIAPQT